MKPTLTEAIIDALSRIQHGWCSIEKALELADTITTMGAKQVVEIGVFGGRSLIPMALACKYQGFGRVVGIDPWEASASVEGQSVENAEWWARLPHDEIFSGFMQNLAVLNLQDFAYIVRKRSDDYEPTGPIDLLHIDGNHSDQAVTDALRFGALVPVGGFAFCDDIGWVGGGVTRAVYALQQMGFEKQYDRDSGAMFKRVRNDTLIP